MVCVCGGGGGLGGGIISDVSVPNRRPLCTPSPAAVTLCRLNLTLSHSRDNDDFQHRAEKAAVTLRSEWSGTTGEIIIVTFSLHRDCVGQQDEIKSLAVWGTHGSRRPRLSQLPGPSSMAAEHGKDVAGKPVKALV